MSFPLIQQPAPLQQLADVLGRIAAAHQARQQQQFENNRALADEGRKNDYLRLNQDEAAATQRHQAALEANAAQELNLQRAQFGATLQSNAALQMDRAQDNKRQLMTMMLQHLPPGVTMSLARAQREASGNKYLPGTSPAPTTVEQDIATARGLAVGGRQGSIVRDARPGSANGITVTPPTLNYNEPAGAVSRPASLAERQIRQSADAFAHAVAGMNSLEDADPNSSNIPGIAAAIEGAGHMPVVGGTLAGAMEPLSQRAMTPNQQRYRKLLNTAVDHYLGALRLRATNQVMTDLKRSLAPGTGQGDPSVRIGSRNLRNYLAQRVRQTAYGENADVSDLPGFAAPGVTPTLAPIMTPSGQGGPTINPRFHP